MHKFDRQQYIIGVFSVICIGAAIIVSEPAWLSVGLWAVGAGCGFFVSRHFFD